MKKQLLALFCALLLLAGTLPSAAALEGDTLRHADALATLDLISDPGTLTDPISRAQAAVLLVRLAGAKSAASAVRGSAFRDAPAWAAAEISYAARQGWISGTDASTFSPNTTVTANAWLTMLLRMLGYDDKAGDFTVHDAPAFAQRIGLVPRLYEGAMTRGDVFETMYSALTFSCKDGSGTVIQRLIDRGACSRSAASALGLLDKELSTREIADRHMAAVFCLDLYDTQEDLDAGTTSGNASGFFISADGLAVTNYHSIEGALYATATLSTGETFPVEKVIYYDADIDIAVIRVSQTAPDGKTTSAFAYLELAGTDEICAGDTVYTLGNPLGLGLAVSSGVISSTAREVARYALPCVMSTADISHGSSGGALMNVYGRVIAVTSGAYTYGNSMYLAVPVDPVLTADLTFDGLTLAEVIEVEKLAAENEQAAS